MAAESYTFAYLGPANQNERALEGQERVRAAKAQARRTANMVLVNHRRELRRKAAEGRAKGQALILRIREGKP